ncbi:MAG: hypothetical protein C3F11_03845 [Methylocystaceae bacterium]|nr:MAG: hypothetical protein C3F11_03845 [Methylocystaceae bacterium]
MNISLEQAIEIHARVLMHRLDDEAPARAREQAAHLLRAGDSEGRNVWLSVADVAERLLREGRALSAPKAELDQ